MLLMIHVTGVGAEASRTGGGVSKNEDTRGGINYILPNKMYTLMCYYYEHFRRLLVQRSNKRLVSVY